MSKKEQVIQAATETTSGQGDQHHHNTIADARRKALEASDKARQAQISYAEEEAKRWYDYKVEE